MSTWTQLTEELSACERQITAIRLKAQEKRKIEQDKVALVQKKREEVIAKHEATLKEFTEEHKRQWMGLQEKATQEIEESIEKQKEAKERCAQAEQDAEASEQRGRELERQVKQLHLILERTKEEQHQRTQKAIETADTTVRMKMEETNSQVQQVSRLASDVQDGALDSISTLTREVRTQMRRQEQRSNDRSRFKELYHVVVRGGQDNAPEKKDQVMKAWQEDWLQTNMNFLEDPQVVMEAKRTFASALDRPRSVQRARAAAELQRARGESPGGRRPCTR